MLMLPAWFFAQPCTVSDASGCVCKDGSTDCYLLPNIKLSYDLLVDSDVNPESPGELRVSVSTPNVGHGPLRVIATDDLVCGVDTFFNSNITVCPDGSTPSQLVKQRIYRKQGNTMTYEDRWAGTMTYHPTHNHSHFDDWGVYSLRIPDPNEPNPLNWAIVGEGAKLGFCLMDYGSCTYYNGHCKDDNDNTLTTDAPNYGLGGGQYSCGVTNQGISAGWTDIYYHYLDGMFITIPNDVCNGDYMIVVEVDPHNVLLEENEDDNVMVAPITITEQNNPGSITLNPTIIATGGTVFCDGESVELSVSEPGTAYMWSNGATTRNITVTDSGTYTCTVTTPCGTETTQALTVSAEVCNNAPNIVNDDFTVEENNVLTENVLSNDNDPDGNNLIVNSIPVAGPTNGTLTLNTDGSFTYTPNTGFVGSDSFIYQACDDATFVTPPTTETYTGQIASGVDDAEEFADGSMINSSTDLDMMDGGSESYSDVALRYTGVTIPAGAVVTNAYIRFTADESDSQATSLTISGELSPNPGTISTSSNSISSKTKTNAAAAWNNIPPWTTSNAYNSADFSAVVQELIDQSGWQSGNAMLFIIEGAGSRVAESYNGSASLAPRLFITYDIPGGSSDVSMCDNAVVNITVEPSCVELNIQAWLEGAYDAATTRMRTTLNTLRGILPGQTPTNPLVTPTPEGQPYSIAPWDYNGTEGAAWTDADYTANMVDWGLVSLRTSIASNTEIAKTAALFMQDGSMYFPDRCALPTDPTLNAVYVVVEHRNHMGVMSPVPVPITNGVLNYDFGTADSYKDATSFGQKQLYGGLWAMYAGDADQMDFPSYDISSFDKAIWLQDNGFFGSYYIPDLNMDGEVNGADKAIWDANNGVSSRVPK